MTRRPTHPGTVFLEDVMKPLNMTVTDTARMLGVSRKALSEFVNEKASLSPEMALRISIATNTSVESWMNMQQKLTLWTSGTSTRTSGSSTTTQTTVQRQPSTSVDTRVKKSGATRTTIKTTDTTGRTTTVKRESAPAKSSTSTRTSSGNTRSSSSTSSTSTRTSGSSTRQQR